MVRYLYDFLAIVSAVLLFIAFFSLLRGFGRKFYVVLIYVAWQFASNLALTFADLFYNDATSSGVTPGQQLYAHLYWTNEVALDLLQFLLVIVLTYKATEGNPMRRAAGRLLAGVVAVVIVLPFLLFHSNFTPWPQAQWFSGTSQMLNFGAAIMNLVLWTALIASKRRDPQLLTVSAGLGVVVTGAAVSYGLRHLIPLAGPKWLPNLFLMLTQIAGWIIWSRAFRQAAKPRQATGDALTSA